MLPCLDEAADLPRSLIGLGILFTVSGNLIQWAEGVDVGNHRHIFLNALASLMLARTVDLILRTLHAMKFKSHGEESSHT